MWAVHPQTRLCRSRLAVHLNFHNRRRYRNLSTSKTISTRFRRVILKPYDGTASSRHALSKPKSLRFIRVPRVPGAETRDESIRFILNDAIPDEEFCGEPCEEFSAPAQTTNVDKTKLRQCALGPFRLRKRRSVLSASNLRIFNTRRRCGCRKRNKQCDAGIFSITIFKILRTTEVVLKLRGINPVV